MGTFTVSVIEHNDVADTINHRVEAATAEEALRQVAGFYPADLHLDAVQAAAKRTTDQIWR